MAKVTLTFEDRDGAVAIEINGETGNPMKREAPLTTAQLIAWSLLEQVKGTVADMGGEVHGRLVRS